MSYIQQLDFVNWPSAVLEHEVLQQAAVPRGLIFSCSGAWRAAASSCSSWADLQLFWIMKSYSQLLVFVSWPAAVMKHEELQPAAVPRGLTFSCLEHGELQPTAVHSGLTCSCSGAWRAIASRCSSWVDFQLFWSMVSYSQKLFLVGWPAAVLEHGELHPEAGSCGLIAAVLEQGELMPAAGPCKLTFSCSGTLRATTSSLSLGAS